MKIRPNITDIPDTDIFRPMVSKQKWQQPAGMPYFVAETTAVGNEVNVLNVRTLRQAKRSLDVTYQMKYVQAQSVTLPFKQSNNTDT